MAYELDTAFDDEQGPNNARRARRREQDRQRMAYRRAIEDYRDSQALHAAVCDFPDLIDLQHREPRPA
ncbi:transcriptional regulator [Halopseudomonas nanhaiensis]|uniref:PA3496 family putative envelope integrity protein n=1 Tax=Halopseudomonas nanhaiensis TaxID=2830842 RepID=UPI001CBCC336|nr:transcriptional regulator [Halopseudomonas nanhaiensis]UAW98378.1 transcriptional regulator [Halopseudomonas nanhaiensis]